MSNKPKDLSESLGELSYFKHYPPGVGESLLEAKQSFVSFLLVLDNFSMKDFSLLSSYEKHSREFLPLFHEWLFRSGVFTNKELSYCSKFRTQEFWGVFSNFSRDKTFYKYFTSFLASYMIIK